MALSFPFQTIKTKRPIKIALISPASTRWTLKLFDRCSGKNFICFFYLAKQDLIVNFCKNRSLVVFVSSMNWKNEISSISLVVIKRYKSKKLAP